MNKIAYVSGITAMVAAIFLSTTALVATQVKADDGGWGSFNGNGQWHCDWQWDSGGHKVCQSYTQHPTVKQVSMCGWEPNSPQCNSVVTHPTIINVAWHCNWQYDSNGYRECISAIQQQTVKAV